MQIKDFWILPVNKGLPSSISSAPQHSVEHGSVPFCSGPHLWRLELSAIPITDCHTLSKAYSFLKMLVFMRKSRKPLKLSASPMRKMADEVSKKGSR